MSGTDPVRATITYRVRSPTDDRSMAVSVRSDGTVLARTPAGEERHLRLRAGLDEDVLEAITAALDDSGFPAVPHRPHADAELAEIEVEAEGRATASATVGLPVHWRDGGWAELVRLLSSLLDQAVMGATVGTDTLEPCLEPI